MASPGMPSLEDFYNAHDQVRFLRLQWIDYSGVLRVRTVTKAASLLLSRGEDEYSVPQACLRMPLAGTASMSSTSIESWKLRPDWTSLMVCGFRTTHAAVMCFARNTSIQDPTIFCPRSALYSSLRRFASQNESHGILIGFEIEFSLHQEGYEFHRPLDYTVKHSMLSGLKGQTLDILEETIFALETSCIDIRHFHIEEPNQYEISLAPLPPMQAADALVMAQETLKTIFIRYGLKVSMTPKPALQGPRHGLHGHLSINPGISSSSAFLAGVMEHLTALCALGMPSFDSYVRLSRLCVGEWVAYGTGNRDLPVRKINENRWEFRLLDATANVYLFLAGVIAAGSNGVESGSTLEQRDCDAFLADLSGEGLERKVREYGVTERLPSTLRESLDKLRLDKGFTELIGRELSEAYLQTKEQHEEVFARMTEEVRTKTFLDFF